MYQLLICLHYNLIVWLLVNTLLGILNASNLIYLFLHITIGLIFFTTTKKKMRKKKDHLLSCQQIGWKSYFLGNKCLWIKCFSISAKCLTKLMADSCFQLIPTCLPYLMVIISNEWSNIDFNCCIMQIRCGLKWPKFYLFYPPIIVSYLFCIFIFLFHLFLFKLKWSKKLFSRLAIFFTQNISPFLFNKSRQFALFLIAFLCLSLHVLRWSKQIISLSSNNIRLWR